MNPSPAVRSHFTFLSEQTEVVLLAGRFLQLADDSVRTLNRSTGPCRAVLRLHTHVFYTSVFLSVLRKTSSEFIPMDSQNSGTMKSCPELCVCWFEASLTWEFVSFLVFRLNFNLQVFISFWKSEKFGSDFLTFFNWIELFYHYLNQNMKDLHTIIWRERSAANRGVMRSALHFISSAPFFNFPKINLPFCVSLKWSDGPRADADGINRRGSKIKMLQNQKKEQKFQKVFPVSAIDWTTETHEEESGAFSVFVPPERKKESAGAKKKPEKKFYIQMFFNAKIFVVCSCYRDVFKVQSSWCRDENPGCCDVMLRF